MVAPHLSTAQRRRASARSKIYRGSAISRRKIPHGHRCRGGHLYLVQIGIVDWADLKKAHGQQTAVCPECGIDSVIGNASGFEITEAFLEEMRAAWFGESAS